MSVIGPRPGLWNQDILTAERDKYNARLYFYYHFYCMATIFSCLLSGKLVVGFVFFYRTGFRAYHVNSTPGIVHIIGQNNS